MTNFVTIEGRALRRAMKTVCAVVERRSSIPILQTARLALGSDGLRITGTNLENDIVVSLDVIDGAGEWATCVNADILAGIANVAGSMPVRIEPGSEAASVSLDDGVAIYTLNAYPADDFPTISGDRAELIEAFTNGMLAAMLDKVEYCISKEETRYYLNGVCWQIKSDGRRFVAADGHRLAACRYSGEGGPETSRIISRRTVEFITTHLPRQDVRLLATSVPTVIDVVAPGMTLRSKLIDGTYPDVDRVIPKEHAFDLRFQREDILAAIDRAAAMRDRDGGRALRFYDEGGRVTIERKNPDFGAAKATTSTPWPGGKDRLYPFAFDGRYIRQVVATCQGEIGLRMTDPSAPFIIADADETMTRVLMPMRA